MKTEVSKYSRPARTPPSTFLFLHLHLSNSPGPTPLPLLWEHRRSIRRQMTTDLLIGCSFTHQNEELHEARNLALAEGQSSAALSGRFIGPPDPYCQRSVVNKSSHRELFSRRGGAVFFGVPAPYLSHNPATI